MTDPYRYRSAETWALAREDYLSGLTAEAVCRRHDLGLSAFRRRARDEGWRRVDQDDPAPGACDLEIYEDIALDEQVRTAHLNFSKALEQGRVVEAMRWRRLWQELVAENRALDAEFFPDLTPDQVALQLAAERQAADTPAPRTALPRAPANVHNVHSTFSSAHSPTTPTAPNRAERRRRARLDSG